MPVFLGGKKYAIYIGSKAVTYVSKQDTSDDIYLAAKGEVLLSDKNKLFLTTKQNSTRLLTIDDFLLKDADDFYISTL